MLTDDFDYELPDDLIAQYPERKRTESRMLVMDRASGQTCIRPFTEIITQLRPEDCLVLNDTQVLQSRLHGRRHDSGGAVEALVLEEREDGSWSAMLRPGKRMRPGVRVDIDEQIHFEVLGRCDELFNIRFNTADVYQVLSQHGAMPLPPYIRRSAEPPDLDRYQTVYATQPGAVAAPTAGLHFSPALLAEIEAMGVRLVRLTLHVGPGTFKPVSVDQIEKHQMHSERYIMPAESADEVNRTKASGGRVIAVGTTSVRVLEASADEQGHVQAGSGRTELFLHPPLTPKVVDGLLTNFHLPRSTLLMLVSTFASVEKVLTAYQTAVAERLRFYSYGDCMLLIQDV